MRERERGREKEWERERNYEEKRAIWPNLCLHRCVMYLMFTHVSTIHILSGIILPHERRMRGGRNVYTKSTSLYQIYIYIYGHIWHLTSCTFSSTRTLLHNITYTHTYTYVCTRCNTKYETLAGDPERPRFDERVCERDIHISLFATLCRKWKRKKKIDIFLTKRIVAR